MTKKQNVTENNPDQGDFETFHLSDHFNVAAYTVMAVGKWGVSHFEQLSYSRIMLM